MSQAGVINISEIPVPPEVATSYVEDSGSAIPSGNILNILGGSGIATSGSGNTVTITATGAPSFMPNAVLQEFDDFISSITNIVPLSKLTWATLGTTLSCIPGTKTNPGIATLNTTNSATYLGLLLAQTNSSGSPTYTGPFALGGGQLSINWVIQLADLATILNPYVFSCGLADVTTIQSASNAFVDGVYFQYTYNVNAGNWTINTTKSSITTTAITSTAVTTNFVNLGIVVNANGTSVAFYINGVQVANSPISTNIPTNSITPFFFSTGYLLHTSVINADLFYVQNILTTPR